MLSKIMHVFKVLLCGVLIAQMTGCGTLMYPGRRGQQGGKVDGGVAVLDGVGLLLFLIPGVIAFAIDFSTGAIYLPGTSRSSLELKHAKVVKFDAKHCTYENLENIIKKETGIHVALGQAEITRLNARDNVKVYVVKEIQNENE